MTQSLTARRVTAGAFDREAVAALSSLHGEPGWLAERRLAAWELADRLPFPSTYERAWKYFDPARLNVEGLRAPAPTAPSTPAPIDAASAGWMHVLNDQAVSTHLSPVVAEQGVVFGTLARAAQESPALMQRWLGAVITPDEGIFPALNSALWREGVFLYVPKDTKVEHPLHVLLTAEGDGIGLLPRVLVVLDRGAEASLVVEQRGGEAGVFVASVAELVLADEARLRYHTIQEWGTGVQEVYHQRAELGRNARVTQVTAALGGSVYKGWVEASIRGAGATSEIFGVAYGTGRQYFDVITTQDHIGDHTVSDLLVKAALKDRAQSSYYGLTRVGLGARMADANQEDRNLLLSDRAKANADPVLEILTSEVARCAHGASAGPVDPEQLFYLECRGLPRPQAEQLLVEGFLGEVTGRITDPSVREIVGAAVLRKLGIEREAGAG